VTFPGPSPIRPFWRILRLVVAALVAAGAAACFFAFRIAGWEPAEQFGRAGYRVASGGWVDGRIVPLLGVLGGGAIGFAALLLITAGVMSSAIRRADSSGRIKAIEPRNRPRRRVNPLRTLAILVIGFGSVIGARWYSYVTNQTSPFQEIGIELNSRAPAPIRDWGCTQLKANFGTKTLPPYGCAQEGDGTQWR
jgi:hypothetical protein